MKKLSKTAVFIAAIVSFLANIATIIEALDNVQIAVGNISIRIPNLNYRVPSLPYITSIIFILGIIACVISFYLAQQHSSSLYISTIVLLPTCFLLFWSLFWVNTNTFFFILFFLSGNIWFISFTVRFIQDSKKNLREQGYGLRGRRNREEIIIYNHVKQLSFLSPFIVFLALNTLILLIKGMSQWLSWFITVSLCLVTLAIFWKLYQESNV